MLWINKIHLFPRKIFTKLYTILNMRVWQKCKWRQRHIDAHCGPELPSAWVTGPCFASSLPIISPFLPYYVWSLIDFNTHFLYIKVKFIICIIKPPSQPKFLKVTHLTSSRKSIVAYKFEGSGRKVVKTCLFILWGLMVTDQFLAKDLRHSSSPRWEIILTFVIASKIMRDVL